MYKQFKTHTRKLHYFSQANNFPPFYFFKLKNNFWKQQHPDPRDMKI